MGNFKLVDVEVIRYAIYYNQSILPLFFKLFHFTFTSNLTMNICILYQYIFTIHNLIINLKLFYTS